MQLVCATIKEITDIKQFIAPYVNTIRDAQAEVRTMVEKSLAKANLSAAMKAAMNDDINNLLVLDTSKIDKVFDKRITYLQEQLKNDWQDLEGEKEI